MKLIGMPTDEELEELKVMGEEARRQIQLQLRPSTETAQRIYDDWAPMKYWGIQEAAVIGIGLDPNLTNYIRYMKSEDAERFHKLLGLLDREVEDGRIVPAEFVKWGRRNKKAVDGEVISEIEKRLQKSERPVDASKKDQTLLKMVLAMAMAKYHFLNGRISENAVASSIKEDFDDLGSGITLSKGAITAALQRAVNENDDIKDAIDRRNAQS